MLASIQRVLEVAPIKGADKIERLNILGWELVSQKDNFKVGDLCVYIEIDTIVPDREEFKFLEKSNFRIKTITLKGQISQGLAMPLTILPKGLFKEGEDVSSILGIKHYEKPIPVGMGGIIRLVGLPFNIPKTDEVMIQSAPELLEKVQSKEVYITTKMDGTSATFAKKDEEYHVCSRGNSWVEDDKNLYWNISRKYQIQEKLQNISGNFAIQGEIVGPGIQKNPLNLKEHELYIFNVFDIDKYHYLKYDSVCNFCEDLRLKMVPVEHVTVFNYLLEELIEMAKGFYWSGKQKEGIVIRSVNESSIISFKVLNNNYKED